LQAFEESFQEILKTKGKEETFVNVKQRLAADFAERSSALQLKEPSWFNDDTNYQDCINEAIDFKVDNMVMLLHELFDSTLVSFAKEGNAKCVSACLASGYAPTQRNELGQTALHTAAMNGHAAIVRSLVSQIKLKEGYEEIIDLADSRHRTALHYGAECGFPEVVEILLETGANINKSEEVQEISDDVLAPRTPLKPQHDKDKDIKKKRRELKRDKVRSSSVPPPVSPPSVTPLHLAVSNGRTNVVAVLVQPRWGCEVMKTQSDQGLSALHMAASHGHAEIAALLIQAGHQINVESSGGTPPLHMAAESNKTEVVKVLLSKKCDINKLGPHRETALQVSARNGHVEVVRLLIACGANVHSRDEWGQTALHLAAIHGESQGVGSLLAEHKDLLDELDLDNRTPLHNAAEYGHVDACQKMLEFKCDISVRDRHGDPETLESLCVPFEDSTAHEICTLCRGVR
jgi:ankyrin repeat protein